MYNLLSLLLLFSLSCNAQIHDELDGSWLPERFVLAVKKDSANVDKFLFPIQGFEISKSRTIQFYNWYSSDYETFDTSKIILILPYKSDLNSIITEEVIHEGKKKYLLPYFYRGLNRKYIPVAMIDWYESANVYISKSGDKLLFEAIGNGKHEKIYFVSKSNNYKFENIEDAKSYLQNLRNKNSD